MRRLMGYWLNNDLINTRMMDELDRYDKYEKSKDQICALLNSRLFRNRSLTPKLKKLIAELLGEKNSSTIICLRVKKTNQIKR